MHIKNTAPRFVETRTEIDGAVYIVKSFFREDARENAEQKLLRLIRECVDAEMKKTDGSVSRSN